MARHLDEDAGLGRRTSHLDGEQAGHRKPADRNASCVASRKSGALPDCFCTALSNTGPQQFAHFEPSRSSGVRLRAQRPFGFEAADCIVGSVALSVAHVSTLLENPTQKPWPSEDICSKTPWQKNEPRMSVVSIDSFSALKCREIVF